MDIAFETDCFYIKEKEIRKELIDFVNMLIESGNTVYIWSGYGLEYAIKECEKFKLWNKDNIIASVKASSIPDIAFDIKEVNLGIINVVI